MITFAAKQAKDSFGLLLDTSQREPVCIQKKSRGVAVVLSIQEYNRLEAIEEAWWASQADASIKKGFIGVKASRALLNDILTNA
jgi:prevent-host-death family protein